MPKCQHTARQIHMRMRTYNNKQSEYRECEHFIGLRTYLRWQQKDIWNTLSPEVSHYNVIFTRQRWRREWDVLMKIIKFPLDIVVDVVELNWFLDALLQSVIQSIQHLSFLLHCALFRNNSDVVIMHSKVTPNNIVDTTRSQTVQLFIIGFN